MIKNLKERLAQVISNQQFCDKYRLRESYLYNVKIEMAIRRKLREIENADKNN